MIKLLIGGSPCTYWSIAQKNNRETEASGMGWELFRNYLIAKEKFCPDYFLYENNKSAAQAIKDQIKQELGVWDGTLFTEDTGARYIEINSALVSAQNRQRFYCHNCGNVEQPEDRGILLKDILETGCTDREKSRTMTASIGRTTEREYFKKNQNTMVAEPVGTSNGKAFCLVSTYWKGSPPERTLSRHLRTLVAEPIRIGTYPNEQGIVKDSQATRIYSVDGKGKTIIANAGGQGSKTGLYAVPVKVGVMPTSKGNEEGVQGNRIYSVDGKSVTQTAQSGGAGSHTGLYAVPVNTTQDGKAQAVRATCYKDTVRNLVGNDYDRRTCVAEPVGIGYRGRLQKGKWKMQYEAREDEKANAITTATTDSMVAETAKGEAKKVYEVKDGKITIKGKRYPIKLQDGFYIIRKLTVTECCRLQTMPDDYCRAVSNSQAYKGLGNGWTAEVIIHILNGALRDVPRDEEIVVLSMYDGIGTGRYCLDKMGFTNVKYYAYEIDKYAMQVAKSNFPDIVELGDAYQLRNEDWSLPDD